MARRIGGGAFVIIAAYREELEAANMSIFANEIHDLKAAHAREAEGLRAALEGLLSANRECRKPNIHRESARDMMRSAEAKADAALAASGSGEAKEDLPEDRDWKDDFQHDNGNYECMCFECGRNFYGHKRRVVCKVCASKPAAPEPKEDAK